MGIYQFLEICLSFWITIQSVYFDSHDDQQNINHDNDDLYPLNFDDFQDESTRYILLILMTS